MLVLATKSRSLQLVVDEPPQNLYNEWARDRIKFYERFEPNEAPRDAHPPKQAMDRLRLPGVASTVFWEAILGNHEKQLMAWPSQVSQLMQ